LSLLSKKKLVSAPELHLKVENNYSHEILLLLATFGPKKHKN